MSSVVVFHHALGLTDGVRAFADELRAAGHDVAVPDLFDGRTFPTVEDGVAHAQEIGFDTVIGRGVEAAATLPADTVYVGFSLGVLPAQLLAQTRPGAAGAALCHGCVPVSEFGPAWPDGVPVQVHGMESDPWFVEDLEAARALEASTPQAELFLYPGAGHLFADPTSPDHDRTAARLLTDRVLALLGRS